MNKELAAYLRAEAIVSAAFNFFINGMVAALIYHKADWVPTDAVSTAIDLFITCLFISTIGTLFCAASLRRTKTEGILTPKNSLMRRLSRLFRHPALFGLLLGALTAAVLSVLTAAAFMLLGIRAIPFGGYVLLKSVFSALLGGGGALLAMRAGMGQK